MTLCPCCNTPLAPGRIVVDLRSNQIANERGTVQLSPRGAEIMHVLVEAAGKVRTKEQIIQAVWEFTEEYPSWNALETQISKSRHGFDGAPGIQSIGLDIRSIRYRGYWLTEVSPSPQIVGAEAR